MIRPPRVTVALLMVVVGAAALTLTWFHSRDVARRVKYRAWKSQHHRHYADLWSNLVAPYNIGKVVVKKVTDGRLPPGPPTGAGARYAVGYTRYATVKIDLSKSVEICRIMASYHEAMSEKWRRACLRPWPDVEPDPPPPVDVSMGSFSIF